MFTKTFRKIGTVQLAGEIDIAWDESGSEVIADEIRIQITEHEDFVLRRQMPGIYGTLFGGFETTLLDQFSDDSDVHALCSAAAKRELGHGHLQRELV
jgi:hypothetical protein